MADARDRAWAFVDLETTGTAPAHARVTEVAVVRVEPDGSSREWSTLVHPEQRIPSEITFITGIDDAMVRDAPRFAEIADELSGWLADAIFIAHNARFDYAFLKAEFARIGAPFEAPTLCTVRLSRLLYPERTPHTLDAIASRHHLRAALGDASRHRALGDARLIRAFLAHIERDVAPADLDVALKRLLKRPSLPARLPPDALDAIPHACGVYLFYGANPHPIYIGKSIDLRDRVGSHFTNDHRSARALRLSQEVERIEWERTAGAFGAELREIALIGERMPAHNVALRRRSNQVAFTLDARGRIVLRPAADLDAMLDADDHAAFCDHFGPFANRAQARRVLSECAAQAGYCLAALGLEKRTREDAPCFNRQLARCAGACVGAEDVLTNAARVRAAFEHTRLPRWPFAQAIHIVDEHDLGAGLHAWHVFDRWRWLGTATETAQIDALIAQAPRRLWFEPMRLLMRALGLIAPAPEDAAQ